MENDVKYHTILDKSERILQPGDDLQSSSSIHNRVHFPTQAGEGPAQSSAVAAASISSSRTVNVGSVMGGIVGGVAFIGILVVSLAAIY